VLAAAERFRSFRAADDPFLAVETMCKHSEKIVLYRTTLKALVLT